MNREYIFSFIYDNTDCLFRDIVICDGGGIVYHPSHKVYRNKAMNFIKRACLSYQINSKFEVPFQSVFYNLESIPFRDDTEYFIVIPNSAIAKFTVAYLRSFKEKHKNVKLLALLVDSMHGHSIQMGLVRDKLLVDVWDYVLTYDKYDAKEFGYIWIGYTYYSSHDDAATSAIVSDLFCIGSNKGREAVYASMYNALSEQGVKCNFRIFSHSKDKCLPGTNLAYIHNFMKYDNVVSEVKSSNCILEILQPDQKMQTIRYFEAIVYNKKLLTNNQNVTELPFYDSRYMRVFNSEYDIDIDWVKSREEICYTYNDEFSPLRLISLMKDL